MNGGPRIESFLFDTARTQGNRTALVVRDRNVSYDELAGLVEAFASEMKREGVQPGERVMLYLEKSLDLVVALYGLWQAGAVPVPTNVGLKNAQVRHIRLNSGCQTLVTNERAVRGLSGETLRDLKVYDPSTRAWSGARAGNAPPPSPEGLATLLYTSGSTGLPKGIAVSHANLVAGARIVSSYLGITQEERILSVLPFHFDYGLNQLLTTVKNGAMLVLHLSPLVPDICQALVRHEITALAGVPPIWLQLIREGSPLLSLSLPSLRYITNSGGRMPADAVARLRLQLPATQLFLMYGLTEAFRSTYLPPSELDRRPDSIGKAIPDCEIEVLTPEGKRCAPGEVGELVHRGPTVSMGYWNDPAATESKFRPDPFNPESGERVVYSGDLVRQDEEGFLYFVSRRDEMIKSMGHRISPQEVEELLFDSGMLVEVVVKGKTDELAGQVVVAHVVPASTFSVDQLFHYCRKQMPSFMVPREIQVHDAFPRTASGKVDRVQLGNG